jgi:TonB-linked SusC/RagA family outer membrane protein
MNNKIIMAVACLMFSTIAMAQQLITGTVSDGSGVPVPGVNVLVKGTSNGATTDFDGNYTINAQADVILVFSYIGYKTLEAPVANRTLINISLEEDQEQLDEVVVIGYGSVKKSEITSSIVSVDGEDLATFKAANPAEALQGKAAGVQVISSGGTPGANPQILIRGITTNAGSSPLIVLDGVPLPAGTSLNFLNSSDVENFQILKDASATAIYGSRASNGAVLITTKRGKEGKTSVNMDFSVGVQNLQKIEMAGKEEYIAFQNQRRVNDGTAPIFNVADFDADTDWWDEVIQDNAITTNLNVNVSGGSEKVKTASSLGYFKQESNYTKGFYERISARLNVDFRISEKLTLKQDINPRLERFEATPGQLFNTLIIDPLTDVLLSEEDQVGKNQFSIYNFGNNGVSNPVGAIKRQFDNTEAFGFISNTQLNYQLTPEIEINSQFAFNYGVSRRDQFFPEYFETGFFQTAINSVSRYTEENYNYVLNNTISFKKQLNDKNYINILGGVLHDYQRFNNSYGLRDGIPSNDDPNLRFLDAATGERSLVSGGEAIETIFSVIGRILYNYDNKYFLTSTVRRDASSKFAEDNRVGIFPSISAAWDIDSEQFFNVNWVDNLRFKIGYGEVGNQNIDRNSQFFSIGAGNYVFGGERVETNFLSQFGNPNLKWETVKDFNIGLNGDLFNRTVDFSIERYKKTSTDLLFNVQLPNFTGVPATVAQNVGSFESNGWDFQLGYNKTFKNDFNFGVNVTVSTNESTAQELAPGNEQIFGQQRGDLGNRFLKLTQQGEIVGAFYGFKNDGIFQNQTEINSHSAENGALLQPNAQPGDLRFVDYNQDGVFNDDDLTIIGNPFPDFFGGVNLNFGYKNFDLSMQWYGTFGNDVLNYTRSFLNSGNNDFNVAQGALNNVWTPENPNAEYPRLSVVDRNNNYKVPSDFFLEDGSYLRLRNIQLGYNFNIKGFQNSRVYVGGQNLLTITNYSGFDPEVQAGGNVINDFGVDYARNPTTRTVLLGLNLTL